MAKQWTPPSDAGITENNKFVPPSDAVEVKKKGVSQSTLDQSNTSSERLSKTTTKPTASLSLKGDGTYTFPGQEGVSFKKEGNNWYRREKDSYEYKQIKEPARINNLEKRALSEEKYSFETAPAPKQEKVKFQAAPKAAPAKPVTQTDKVAQKAFTEEFQPLALDSPEYLKRKKESESIESKVNQITPDLINDNEGDVVPRIKDLIKDYPYLSVSESGMGYDELEIVNNATGEREKINLENWTSDRDQKEAKRLQGFLDIQMNSKDYVDQYKKVNYIKSQMSDATPTDRIKLSEQLLEEQGKLNELKTSRYLKAGDDQYKLAALYDKNAKENIKTDFANLQLQTIDYSEKVKSYSDWTKKINEARKAGKITDEQYQTEYAPKLAEEKRMLIEEKDKISKDFTQTRSESDSIDNIAANQYAIESERGNILTGASFSALQGAENSLRFLLETGDFQDGEFKGLLTQAAPGSISETYTSAEGRNSLEQIVFGLANSGGSALVGAAIGSPFLGLYASSYVNMKDQMSSPAFKDVPEWQKILMSGVYGGTVGVLEKYGVSKWFQKTPAGRGLTNWILKKTISELGEDASSEAIELAIKKNLNAAVANGLIQITSAGLVEGSTELAQEGADMIYKDVFNKLSEKKYFENPKSWAGVADRLSQSFILGFAGGAGMNSISQATEIGRNELTKAQIDNITQFINDPELQDTFKMNLKDQILSGQITKDDAKRQVERLNELEGTIKKIPENVDRYQAFKLLNERDDIQKEIAGKDPALVAAQTERINAINEELKTISQNAVQKQTTSEVFVQPGAEVGGEVAKGESQAEPQVIAEESQKVEIGGIVRGYETISGEETLGDVRSKIPEQSNGTVVVEGKDGGQYAVAFSRKGADGKNIFEQGSNTPRPGYISASVKIAENATPEQIQAAQQEAQRNLELIIPAVVDGSINVQAVNDIMAQQPAVEPSGKTGQLPVTEGTISPQVDVAVETEQVATYRAEEQAELLKAIPKIESYKVNGEIDKTLMPKTVLAKYNEIYDKYDKLISPLLAVPAAETTEEDNSFVYKMNTEKTSRGKGKWEDDFEIIDNRDGGNLGKESAKWAVANRITGEMVEANSKKDAADIIKNAPSYGVDMWGDGMTVDFTELGGKEQNKYREEFNKQKNLVINQKETNLAPDETGKQKAGNRLFNEPLKAVAEIANRYHERIFGSKRPKYEGTTELNTERSKRIAAAFEAMKHEPNNPEVKKAYEAMAKETIDQYQDFLDAGYVVEINNEEPYANSADMIEDLRKNKRIKIFSTESGFGDDPITPEQRAENPLLATTEFTDVNGQPMLVNDLFRAVHDFFGHAELGNSFGPKGEENAWNVHSRMYSPLARRAMTTETRGQNSWVNFSGFNDEIQKLRDKAAKLRDEGKIDEAAEVVGEIYDKFKFADQKIGLLPIEFSEVDQDIEDVLTADTKDATNLEKVLNALDKIEGDLDQFGKETLGINIPVVLAKALVKAVKALVKAGITLEQAIKQVAAENGLNDRDVKSLFNPTKVSQIDVNEVRSKSRPGKRVSKGLSVKTVDGKKVIEETEDLSLEYVKQNAPSVFISNANIIAKYPLVAGKQKFRKATTVEQAQKIYDVFVREVADNLNYLMAEFKPEFREISTLWYDGANALANDFADQFDVSPEQAAGIIAAMSPQKDWYQNVRLAELVMMAYKDNPVMSQEMIDYQKGVNKKSLYDGAKSAGKKLKKAEKEYSESRTKLNREALEEAKVKLQEAINKADALIEMLEKYLGQNLKNVPADVQPYMVRTYHEINTTKDYNIVAPDGSVQGVAKKKKGGNAKVAWGSYSEIGKAVAIYNDGSQENITRSLGEMHKIRNFYNNIIDPMSADGDVTMDTHAIAAALLLPLSGKSTQVGQNFGTKTSNSGPLGIKGLYYAYADAYALAAKETGLLPRQIQSITWEAVRGLYTDTFKGNKEKVAQINNIWKNYQDGKITINEAREQAKEAAGGIQDPTWAGGPLQDESGESIQEEGIESGSDRDGRDIVGGELGGEILTADTKNPTVLRKVQSALNKADDDLAKFGRETLGINIPVVTMRAIIKLAKVLVKTGITLQEAIIQAAEQKNVSKKDALNAIKFMVETINRPIDKVVVNETAAIKDQIRLEARAARDGAKSVSEAVKAITAFFKEKSNQANLTRANLKSIINIISSVKDQKTLDSAADKIYNIISSAKSDIIEVNEASALKDQLRLEARAAREAKTDLNTKRKQIAAFIRSLETKGTITARQAAALVKRVSSLNLDNQTMVDRFEQYAENVFKRAEYQDLLTSAFKVRRLIRKAIKSENQAEVVGMAKLFSKIDPSLVDDIDNYIALAESVLNAVRPSKEAVKDPALRQAVNIEAIAEYANEEIAKQEENRKRELMAEYKYLVDSGFLIEDLSVKEMQEIINLIENPTAQFDPEADQKKLNFLQNRLASMEAVFRYMLANNINPFTGEDVVIDPKDADLIKRLLKMDLNEMSVREAAKVVEAMDNFLMNNITSGLEAAVKSYEGAQNAKQLVDQGKIARKLRSYFNDTIGRIFGEQFISLPLLFEKMFPGIKNAANIMQMMGLVDVINGSNKAIRQQHDLMTEYSKQDFYKEKEFMEAKNVYERGMLAFLKRNLIGTKTEIRDEFKRRADIIKQSIEALRENGTDKEKEMADLYQEVYDKLGVAELDLDVIEARASKMNKDAVAWMINQWGKHYGELADVSLSVYNSILGSDTNYTPDRYKILSSEFKGLEKDLLNNGSGFMMSMDYTDKSKTGVLIESTRPKSLPKNEKNRTTKYISLDFDVNNFNSLKGALVDINTAAAIRQVDGFINSKAFNRLVPQAKDRDVLTGRINTYIQRVKGKRTASTDTIKDVERLANFVTGLGVGKALAGLDQPIKQTVPVMINTFINSNGNMTFVNPDMNEAINRSGMPIANRGLESQTAVESIDRLLEKTGGLGAEAIKKLEDLNQFWLKTLLAKPDVWVARSSFITYYLKDMRSKGINVKDINWKTHEWDKDSAQYAQIMVDRQQNISDDKLAGDFLSSDDPTKRIARKVIMPFATFIMNQKARMHNDILAFRSKDTSKQDRISAAKSLAGLAAELAAYQLIAYGIKTLVYDSIANALVGDDEEEKKDKSFFGLKMTTKQFNATKFPVKSIVGDIISPLPFLDDFAVMGFDKLMERFPQISNEDIKKAVEEKNAILRFKGEDEMDDKTKTKFIEQLKSDNIYSVAFKNDGQSGRSYGMIGIAYDTYKELIDLSAMAYTGEFEDEYQGRVTNKYLPEEDRKILQNISVPLMILYSTGIAPKDLGTVSRKVTNIVKKKGVTENQHEKEKEVKKQMNRDLSDWEFELVKGRKKTNGIVDEINYVESKGGLDNKQGKEYVKLMDAFPSPSDDMLRDIQKGMTAEQIIKRNTE